MALEHENFAGVKNKHTPPPLPRSSSSSLTHRHSRGIIDKH
jgi:hypothetical protein